MQDQDAADRSGETGRVDPERAASRARDTALVLRVRAGDDRAFGELYDAWFDRIFDLVSRIVRDQEVAAEVTQDAFLSAWRGLESLDNPDAFGGWLLRIGRNAAFNRSTKEQRSRPVDEAELAVIESVGAGANNAPSGFGVEDRLGRAATPGVALEDSEVVGLVWQAAEALPARDLEVLDLQLRHGMSPAEIGEMLGINRNAANQLSHRVRGRLEIAIRARVLWRSGEPVCEVLAKRLSQAKVVAFDAEAVRVIERHIPGCEECDERQRLRLQPTALFAALPIMAAPLFIKTQACAALTAAGVPMGGSTFAGSSIGGASGASSSSAPPTPAAPSPLPIPYPVAPAVLGPTDQGPTDQGAARRWGRGLGVAAAILVLLFMFGGGMWWAGRGSSPDGSLVAAGTAVSIPQSTRPPSSPPDTRSGSSARVVVETTTPSPTTAAPRTTSTKASTTTTEPATGAPTSTSTSTSTSTTQPRPRFTITFSLTPAKVTWSSWGAPAATAGVPAPTLTWDVAPKDKGKVAVTGPDNGSPSAVLSNAASGSYAVCPGVRSGVSCSSVPNGDYVYTLTVTGPDGTVWETRTQTLTVNAPPIIG